MQLQTLRNHAIQMLMLCIRRSSSTYECMQCLLQAAVLAVSSPGAHTLSAAALRDAALLTASITDSVEREHVMMVRLSTLCSLSQLLVPWTALLTSISSCTKMHGI